MLLQMLHTNTALQLCLITACHTDEMSWSHSVQGGEEAGSQTEEAAMTVALTRAFRAIDEEVIGSVCASST